MALESDQNGMERNEYAGIANSGSTQHSREKAKIKMNTFTHHTHTQIYNLHIAKPYPSTAQYNSHEVKLEAASNRNLTHKFRHNCVPRRAHNEICIFA